MASESAATDKSIDAESEPMISNAKTEDLKDAKVPSTSENKPEKTPALSTDLKISEDKNVESEIEAKANPEPSIDSVIESTSLEDTKSEVQEPVPAEILTTVSPDAFEAPGKDVFDPNAPTSINLTVKDLEVESGMPEEQSQELLKKVVPHVSEAPEKVDLNSPTSIAVPVKDLEIESGSPEEQKQEKTTYSQEPISNATSIIGLNDVMESSSYDRKALGDTEAVEKKDDSIKLTVKDLEAESGTPEEQTPELLNAVVSNVSEAPEKVDNLNAPTSIEVPVKDLEVESGSPEEQKQEKTTDSQEPISNATSITGLNEVMKSSSYEGMSSEDVAAVEKKDDSIKVTAKDLEVESGTPEELTQELLNEVVPNVSEAPEKVDDLNAPTSIEVLVKDLEVESGSPEEHKQGKTTDSQEQISNATSIADLTEVMDSSSYEGKASGDAEAVEKKDDSIKVTVKDLEVESDVPEEQTQELLNEVIPNVSEAPENVHDLNAPTSIEVLVKDLELESGSPEEHKQGNTTDSQEPISNATSIAGLTEVMDSSSYEGKVSGDAEAVEKKDDSIKVTVKDLEVESDMPEEQTQELLNEVVPNVSEAPENVHDLNAPTSIEVVLGKDLEVESGSPEEQKQEKTTDSQGPISNATSIAGLTEVLDSSSYEGKASGDAEVVEKKDDSIKVTVKDLVVESGMPEEQTQELLNEVVHNDSEAPEKVDDLNAPTSIEVVHGKDLEVESGSPEEQKQEKTTDSQEPISNATSTAGPTEVMDSSSYEGKASGDAEAVEKKDDRNKIILKDLVVESGMPEEQTEELLNAVVHNDSEAPEKVDDLNAPTSIEVPLKDLEVEFGLPEEQKQEKAIDSQESISNATSITGLNEVVESSSYEEKASGDAEAVEEKYDSLEEERSEPLVETHEDLEAKTEVPQTPSSEEVGNKREDENIRNGSPPVVLISPEGEKASEPVELFEEKDEALKGDSIDDTRKVADASVEGEKTLEGDKVLDKEKAANEEAVAEVPSEQERAAETAEIINEEKDMGINIDTETLEATPKNHDIAPDATEVPSVGENVSADSLEKNESMKDENATSVEAPKGFTAAGEPPQQVMEGKENENSVSEKGSPANISREFDEAEPSTEIVKDIGALETVEDVKDETSKDLSLKEKNVKVPEDRKDEVKLEETIGTTTDMLENEHLGTEKQESEKKRDPDPIVTSETGDAKLIKEVAKRGPTNIFSKVKRSIVKAKKAILGKSPGPKNVNVSADAKDVNS